mgnify:CR=1 FL=1
MKTVTLKNNCIICKKLFNTFLSRIKVGKGKYCSVECRIISTRGKIPYNKTFIFKQCLICKKKFKVITSRLKTGRGKYCSKKCAMITFFTKGQTLGMNNNMWKGGISLEKQYYTYRSRLRKLRKIKVGGTHTIEQWKELKNKYKYTCLCCKKTEPKITLTEDHIIPITKKGTDFIDNIQPLCRSCNSHKHTKIINYLNTII